MKSYKKIVSLVLGSAFMFSSGFIIANAQEKTDKIDVATNKSVYTEVSDDNQNYFGTDEDFYREMYNHCHGNNSNYRNNMMRDYDNTNSNLNNNELLENL